MFRFSEATFRSIGPWDLFIQSTGLFKHGIHSELALKEKLSWLWPAIFLAVRFDARLRLLTRTRICFKVLTVVKSHYH